MKFRIPSLIAAAALSAGLITTPSASADVPDVGGVLSVSPAGSNDWSCTPSAEHPEPVVLVPGTFESMVKNWSTLSPVLKKAGYCVFALDYGVTNGVPAAGPVRESAAELGEFVDRVLAATGARKVDLVGHSQGGMMPRYYLGFLGGAKKVDHLIGLAPSNHGTEGVISPATGELTAGGNLGMLCQACDDQAASSPFMQELNSIGDLVNGPVYTVVSTRYDEVVTPYQSQFLAGSPRRVTNITLQDLCPLDPIEHDQLPNDPAAHQLVVHALSRTGAPADPAYRPACL
ncbi:esterase/lipase family protein [Arthrobacter sp. TMS1-12-1]